VSFVKKEFRLNFDKILQYVPQPNFISELLKSTTIHTNPVPFIFLFNLIIALNSAQVFGEVLFCITLMIYKFAA